MNPLVKACLLAFLSVAGLGSAVWAQSSNVMSAVATSVWEGAYMTTNPMPRQSAPTGSLFSSWSALPKVQTGEKGVMVQVPYISRLSIVATPQDMVLVPAAVFRMGNAFEFEGTSDELPAHEVSVNPYFLDVYEVSFDKWTLVRDWGLTNRYSDLPAGTCGYSAKGKTLSGDHPVTEVSWFDCVKWCNARSEMEGLAPAIYYTELAQTNVYRIGQVSLDSTRVDWSADGYRLPTEAEWEYAARGKLVGRRYPSGNSFKPGDLNMRGNGDPFDEGTTPCGHFNEPNGYGLFDMMGNVFEWCWDWYGPYSTNDVSNPRGPPAGKYRVLRGGAWNCSFPVFFRCAYRHYYVPNARLNNSGFRTLRRL